MEEFVPRKLTAQEYSRRRDEATAAQLAALTTDPAFLEWQRKKAVRENRASTATNLLAVAACTLLLVTMALLKPAASGPGPQSVSGTLTSPAGETALLFDEPVCLAGPASHTAAAGQADGEAVWETVAELSLQLRVAEQARDEAAARLAELEAAAEAARIPEQAAQAQAAELEAAAARLAQLEAATARIAEYEQAEVEAAEARLAKVEEAAARLAELEAAAAAAREAQEATQAQAAQQKAELQAAEGRLAELEAAAARVAEAEAAAAAARAAEEAAQAQAAQQAAQLQAVAARVAELEGAAARLAEAEAAAAAAHAAEEASQAQVAGLEAQLVEMAREVAAAEAAAQAAASLVESTAAVAVALADAQPLPGSSSAAQSLLAPAVSPDALPVPYANATFVLPAASLASLPMGVPRRSAAAAFQAAASIPAAALYSLVAAVVCGALAAFVYLRDRRALAAEAARSAQLAARLKATSFAKDTVEQSLGLLETELQRRMKQLEEAQQRAADAASPKIGTAPEPLHTPGRGELPPPPAKLIEKFLRDHNFLAVQQEQMQEWLEMEQQMGEMQNAVGELQAALAEKDAQLEAYAQDFAEVNEHSKLELRAREEQLAQMRSWLDEAQDELLTTQGALAEREVECRRIVAQMEALQAAHRATQANSDLPSAEKARDTAALQEQNLELVSQLQSVTAAYEEMQEQLSAAAAAQSGASHALTAFTTTSERPASAASTMAGTPADLTREVQSCLEMMRATREQLADRLSHSQGLCESMIADCHEANNASRAVVSAGAAFGAGVEAAAEAVQARLDAAVASGAFGSPAVAASPAASEHTADTGAEEAEEPIVLGVSRMHHINLPSPASSKQTSGQRGASHSPACSGASNGSMRSAWQAAHTRVAEARGRHTGWDLAGFVRDLGFQIEVEGKKGAPVDRADFESLRGRVQAALQAAAGSAATADERALAGEAQQVLRDWEFPAQRINTPPPQPFWHSLLGLQA